MREQEFKARDKKVQKMTRDGLVEKNLTRGSEQRISGRLADMSFERAVKDEDAVYFADAAAPKVREPANAPVSMRDAGDKPVQANRPASGDNVQTERHGGKQKRRKGAKETAWNPDRETESVFRTFRDPEDGHLQFGEKDTPGAGTGKKSRHGMKKRQTEGPDSNAEKQEDAMRLHYERSEIPAQERAAEDTGQGRSRQQKKYEKAQHRLKDAEEKLEKAKDSLPKRRVLRLEKQYKGASGKARRRLQFEDEIIPEYGKPPMPKRAAEALGRAAPAAAVMGIHQKIRETERDNAGVEAAHKAEFAAKRMAGRIYRSHNRRLSMKPYRILRREEQRAAEAEAGLAYRKFLKDNPELQKKAVAKWIQKQRIRRRYAQAAREAAKGARHTGNVLTAAGQAVRAVIQAAVTRKTVVGIIAAGVLIVGVFGSLFTSCSAMLTGIESAVISTCYVADDGDINESELKYTELETDLQKDIKDTEDNFPGFDEYRYNIGEIGHNPYELMGYLSAAYDAFTYAQVEAELYRLFNLHYRLTREETIETGTYTDEDGEEQEYEIHILKTTLSVRPLTEIIAESLTPGDQTDRYGVYMLTCGNRQCYGNPFDTSWLGYVTSPYGYRLHPDTGGKDLHRGIDIGMPQGTPIKAIQDGCVASAGNAGDYGQCIVIEGEDGYQSKYAHCASLLVNTGQEVKRGDVIATVGNTGNSTGAHLHLEVIHNGEYLNPYYFVDNGGDGYTAQGGAAGSPQIPDYSGEPMGDGSFAAMLAEAEKYLGYPYVWGGSSPSTSFDCSGYVSWVINRSGVGNVGRQTAQGLYNICTPVSSDNLQPGDLVFFTGTYSSASPVSHVGIYVGGGLMIHCGDPISYASINSSYWTAHFYSGGRLP